MLRHGSKVPIVPIAAALAILTGCARGEAVAPDRAAADFAAAAADSAALQDHGRHPTDHTALTAEALAAHLDLSPAEEARIRAALDSLHTEMMLAAKAGPDALVTAARSAHARLEAALPPAARPAFQAWMQQRQSQMHGDGHGPAGDHGMHRRMPEGGHASGTRGGG